MYQSPSEAERAQRELSYEVDKEAARLIREEGIPLYNATEIALKNIQRQRRVQSGRISPKELIR